MIPLVNSMDVPGILTRNVDDCVSILNTIAGFDPKDSTSLTKPFKQIRLPPGNKLGIKDLKIGIPVEYHNEYLSDEVYDTWNEISNLLEQNGAKVEQVFWRICFCLYFRINKNVLGELTEHGAQYSLLLDPESMRGGE